MYIVELFLYGDTASLLLYGDTATGDVQAVALVVTVVMPRPCSLYQVYQVYCEYMAHRMVTQCRGLLQAGSRAGRASSASV